MTHEEALPRVVDWARGRLDATTARAVESHVRICRHCAEAAEAAARVETDAARAVHEAAEHPSAEALARYVLAPDDEAIATLARTGAHLRACAPCREDAALARAAAQPPWWRGIAATLAAPAAPARAMPLALAAVAVALAFPAWRGMVELPRERAAIERRVREAESRAALEAAARARAERPPAPRGGGAAALVLGGATRGADGLPAIAPRADQALQPVLVDVRVETPRLSVTLVREGAGPVWTAEGPRAEFWDEANGVVGLLVPTAALAPGAHRLELRAAPDAPPFLAARFRVEPPRTTP